MRRLTVILSDLYLPADAVRETLADTVSLPSLEWLLRFSQHAGRANWRPWLATRLAVPALAEANPAAVMAARAGVEACGAWLAAPVHLEARLDHVRLRDRGLLWLSDSQRELLRAEFATSFGPDLRLHDLGPQTLLLEGGPRVDATTCDPARWLDADIGPALPGARAAGELRRLTAEIEMWLHSAAINRERERAGQRRITSLWLWGGGAAASPPTTAGGQTLYGTDFWLQALTQQDVRLPPPRFAQLLQDDAVVQFAPMSGTAAEQLPALEVEWFAPIRLALRSGQLSSLTLLANDQVFHVTARAGWRFWRARRGWLATLAKA